MTDASGNINDTYDYEAFGGIVSRTGTTENRYLFTGEQYDPNIGFYYLRARYYNPGNGRFVTRDTYPGNVYEPVTLHKYLYANANPVMYIDPGGECGIVEMLETMQILAKLTSISGVVIGIASQGSKRFIYSKEPIKWTGDVDLAVTFGGISP